METKVLFKDSKGNKLSGILSTPVSNADIPIVILCHGLNSSKDSKTNIELGNILEKRGIASFRFDFFGHQESEGKPENRTVDAFVDDILSAVSYLKDKGYKEMGIVGASFGGLSAVIAASKTNDLKFMALKSPGMGKTSRKMPNYKEDFDAKTWFAAGKEIKIPTLIVHGSADEDVELEFAKSLAECIKNSKLEIISGADHQYTKKEDFERMIKLISGFVIENVSKNRTKLR